MSETIMIDVTSEYTDHASSGLNNTGKNADVLEKKMNKAAKSVDNLSRKNMKPKISLNDKVTQKIKKIGKSVDSFQKKNIKAKIDADDKAFPRIKKVTDLAQQFGRKTYKAGVLIKDKATLGIQKATKAGMSFGKKTFKAIAAIDDKVSGKMESIKQKMFSLNSAVAATGVGLAAGGFVSSSVKTYAEFSQTMSEVKAISGATGTEFDKLTNKAKKLGATTKFTASEAAQGMKYMGMAGWSSGDIQKGIGGVLNLAAASGEDLGKTSDIVTDAMTAFNMGAGEVNHFSDILAQASSKSNTNVGYLGESFKYVASTAGALKYSAEDTSIALGLMANAGIKGSMSGTSLKTSLANMASPTKSMAGVMDKYNISLTDSKGNMKSLGGVMDNLRSSLGGLSETEQTAAASTLFGKEAMAGMLSIVNASDKDYKGLTKSIYNSDGAAKKMADTMLNNLAGKWTIFTSAVDGVKNTLGEKLSPYLIDVLNQATKLMPKVEKGISKVMGKFDKFYKSKKIKLKGIIDTEDFKTASLSGKFEKIGAELGKSALKGLKKSLTDLLPGGEKAGMEDYITALLGFKVGKDAFKIGKKGFDIGKGFYEFLFGGGDGDKDKSNPFGGKSVGAMTVSANAVYVNGSTIGGSKPGKGNKPSKDTKPGTLPSNNPKQPKGSKVERTPGGLFGFGGKGITLKDGNTVAASGAKAWFGNLGVKLGSGATTAGGAALAGGIGAAGIAGTAAGLVSAFKNINNAFTSKDKTEKKKEAFRGGTKLGMIGSGAAAGAAIGSVIPGAGTLIGGLAGAGIGGAASVLKGNKIGDWVRKKFDTTKANDINKRKSTVNAVQSSAQNFMSSPEYKKTVKSASTENKKYSKQSSSATKATKSYTSKTSSAGGKVKGLGSKSGSAGGKVSGLGSKSSSAGGQVSGLGTKSGSAGGQVSGLGSKANTAGGSLGSFASAVLSAIARINSAASTANAIASGKTYGPQMAPGAKHATGGYIGNHIVSELGEEGPEMVIPLSNHRSRALALWNQAGQALGVTRHAKGGLFGSMPSPPSSSGSAESKYSVSKGTKGGMAINVGGVNITINVTGGSSEGGSIVDEILARKNEVADAVMEAIADVCGTSYTNRTAEVM